MRILIAEDNLDNSEMLSRRLRKRGYEVMLAFDGAEAVREASSQLPDVILMDVSMPVMSGLEAAQELRKHDATRNIPIIALTAHAMSSDRQACIDSGCTSFATKPIDFAALIDLIERHHTPAHVWSIE
jgi:two-component system, cell cycle response regulator DivK